MLRDRGVVHRAAGRITEAESDFRAAVESARKMGAKGFELDAAFELAKLYASERRRKEAAELLVPLYEWFTEGHQTPVLQEAKALLEELS